MYLIHADTLTEMREWTTILETNLHWLNEKREYIDPRLTIKEVTIKPEKEGLFFYFFCYFLYFYIFIFSFLFYLLFIIYYLLYFFLNSDYCYFYF